MTATQQPRFSVVIPAHDEESRIDDTLAFVAALEPGEAEVVVVANGCSDRTAARARSVPGVQVIEVPSAGKTNALNAGDRLASCYPRVYLDADVVVDAQGLRRLAAAVDGAEPLLAAPRAVLLRRGRPWTVRAYFDVFERLPHTMRGLSGCGVYALSRAGRDRFGAFPAVTADDLFVERLFAPAERTPVPDAESRVEVPHTLRDLLAVRTRVAFGNTQLAQHPTVAPVEGPSTSTRTTLRALLALLSTRPRLLPSAAVYVGVTCLARLRARSRGGSIWHRDRSTR